MVLLRTKFCYPIFEFWEGEIMAIRLVTWYSIQKIIQFWLHLFAFQAKVHVIHLYIRDVSIVTEIKQFGHFWIGFSYSKSKTGHCSSQAVNRPICIYGYIFLPSQDFFISLWESNDTTPRWESAAMSREKYMILIWSFQQQAENFLFQNKVVLASKAEELGTQPLFCTPSVAMWKSWEYPASIFCIQEVDWLACCHKSDNCKMCTSHPIFCIINELVEVLSV